MTTVCLIRHGQTDWNIAGRRQGTVDIELNAEGIKQAKKAAEYLKNGDWEVVISSPLIRAKITAEIIAEAIGVKEVKVIDGFTEREFGEASGLKKEEVAERYPNGEIPFGEEGWETVCKRGLNALNTIAKKYPNKKVIVVSHGALIRSIIETVSEGNITYKSGYLNNASFNILHNKDDKWEIEVHNAIEHLGEVAITTE